MAMYLFECELEKKYINIQFALPTSNFMDIILLRVSRVKKASQFMSSLRGGRKGVAGDGKWTVETAKISSRNKVWLLGFLAQPGGPQPALPLPFLLSQHLCTAGLLSPLDLP